jgi:hypothetical protein
MKKWYWSLNKAQKIFVYIISILAIFPIFIGLIPLTIFIFFELGGRPES